MDKKKYFASLMEDHSPDPSVAALRPLSPFGNGGRSGTGAGAEGSACASSSRPGFALDLDQDQQPVLSCVTKETSQEDCARHRFIVWAAVKRNTSVNLPHEQKLECPLLRCTRRFADHEAMLRHLAECRHLASGEYWCYDHNRVERFDDLKCKRCLGHPSKRRKILRMAKTFFHSLGHKSKKGSRFRLDDDEATPPPPYDSLNIPCLNGNATELPSTEILEIDSVEVPAMNPTFMPSPSDAIDPQALLIPSAPPLPELDSTMLSNETLTPWQPVPGLAPHPYPFAQQEYGSVRVPVARPMLQLTTNGLPNRRQAPPRPVARPAPTIPRSKGLSPSSSVRSTASTDTNASMMSNGSSLVSPISNWSGAWSMASGLNTNMTSPVEGMLTDDIFAEAMHNACPDSLHQFYSELPADKPVSKVADDTPSDHFFAFDEPPEMNMTYAPDIVLTEDTAESSEIDEHQVAVEQINTCCSETKSLVGSAWDALQEHIVSSMVKIQDHQDNPLANQLSSMSIRTVATTALRTLRALIGGRQPSCASDALCLVHLIYAFSLVLHEQDASPRYNSLFLQSLAYAGSLPPGDRDFYRQLATSIWQPPGLTQADINQLAISNNPFCSSADRKGKSPEIAAIGFGEQDGDPLLVAARDFLDELEMSLVLGEDSLSHDVQVQVSDLHIKHLKDMSVPGSVNLALLGAVRYILEILSREFGDAESLKTRLRALYSRLSSGTIGSVRRIEIELLQAGKCCLAATEFFSGFVPNVRRLCDQIYDQLDVGAARRDVYHELGVSLIESLIPEFDNSAGKAEHPSIDDFDAFLSDLEGEAGASAASAVTSTPPPGPPAFDSNSSGALASTVATTTPAGMSSSSHMSSPAGDQGRQPASSASPEQKQSAGQKVEANSCCEICGYRPKGDPQWFKGSMAKHKKLQHSTHPPIIYECPYPGCTSRYKNRPDNLRQHQIEKNHWVQGDENTPRRPSKRKKVATEE